MRVIVCGGRDYDDYDTVKRVLAHLGHKPTIVHGAATGADALAETAAHQLGLPVDPFHADWYGPCRPECHHRPRKPGEKCPAAGPYRNRQMLDAGADLVIAFPGGRGTADMVAIARDAGVPVLAVQP